MVIVINVWTFLLLFAAATVLIAFPLAEKRRKQDLSERRGAERVFHKHKKRKQQRRCAMI